MRIGAKVVLGGVAVAVAAGAACSSLRPGSGRGPESLATAAPAPELAARIARIEAGLLPKVVIDGRGNGMTIAARMQHYNIPGVSVAVINGNKLEWAKGYGTTQMNGSVPVTADTIFEAGSIAKAVTAAGALALVAAGKLELDGDVNGRLVSWRLPDGPLTQERKVTLRRLASHSAGLPTRRTESYNPGETIPTVVQVLDGSKPAKSKPVRLERAPGAGFSYSNGGYTIMQVLMSDVAGQPFETLLRQLVFDKLAMKDSFFEQPLPLARQAAAAVGYDERGKVVGGPQWVTLDLAAGGLRSTAPDLARFALAVLDARTGASKQWLAPAMAQLMLTRQFENWGFGVELVGEGRALRFGHGGSTNGFKCQLWVYPELGQGAVVMTNGEQGRRLGNEIFQSLSQEYRWPDFKPIQRPTVPVGLDVLTSYVGEYGREMKVRVTLEQGSLYFKPPGQPADQLWPSSPTEFFVTTEPATFAFTKDKAGTVTGLKVRLNDGTVLDNPKVR